VPTHTGHNPVRQRVNPLEVVSDDLIAKVDGWRCQRMSWDAIGRNLGVSAATAKARFEAGSSR
jgi:hypothetical protein